MNEIKNYAEKLKIGELLKEKFDQSKCQMENNENPIIIDSPFAFFLVLYPKNTCKM